ncbi:Phosphatidylinositol-4-phosphate 5-kinase [Basidiobolus ranarum]|uniref:Phosphatidylinositol-4-phosphate 5-kinase n=1 Tax=Basidiobolus ranarum TaxID=34480 RepID=A0ABR2WQM1_9FUNG
MNSVENPRSFSLPIGDSKKLTQEGITFQNISFGKDNKQRDLVMHTPQQNMSPIVDPVLQAEPMTSSTSNDSESQTDEPTTPIPSRSPTISSTHKVKRSLTEPLDTSVVESGELIKQLEAIHHLTFKDELTEIPNQEVSSISSSAPNEDPAPSVAHNIITDNPLPLPHSPKNSEPPTSILRRRSEASHHSITSDDIEPYPEDTAYSLTQRPTLSKLTIDHSDVLSDLPSPKEPLGKRISRRLSIRRTLRRKNTDDDDFIAIGTRVDKNHKNYVLMYNMLTGIRVAVSRYTAKVWHELTPEDFKAAHKLAFDVVGNELTPSSQYDFKFKDYAPWVFRHLRALFGVDSAEYLISLTSKYIVSELGSPGKSGSFFYYSRDYRFIIKTIHHAEHKFLRKILPKYYQHVKDNPNTLLCRFYGLHRVKLPHSRKIHFIVMANNLPPNKDIHETYDLKGSSIGRELSEEELVKNPHGVMKDINWERRGRKLELGPNRRQIFVDQMISDVELLKKLNIMDYSLLVGLHDLMRGNRDNIRDNTLSVFKPNTARLEKQLPSKRKSNQAAAVRKLIVEADPVALGPSSSELPESSFEDRRNCIFYQSDGGFIGQDEDYSLTNTIFYVGIIDILTPYNFVKKIEHYWKSLSYDQKEISAVRSSQYADRFLKFMIKAIKNNEDVHIPPELFNPQEKKHQ